MQQKVEKAKLTCIEMMKDRNYEMCGEEDGENFEKCIIFKNEREEVICFFISKTKLNIALAREFLSYAKDKHISHLLIIYNGDFKNSITPKTKECLENLDDIRVEFFTIGELQYNVTKHVLVPKHVLATKEERDDIKKRYKIVELPILLKSDPISRYYNFKVGDIIKIMRKKSIIFRVVG